MLEPEKKIISSAATEATAVYQGIPVVEVVIEIPRGSFLKRGSTGKLDFVSPLPCPFNYGSIPAFIGLEGDLLDAVVLGPRLPAGEKIKVYAWGAIGLTDRGLYDDKLICSQSPVSQKKQKLILIFFQIYAKAKSLLNLARGRKGLNRCEGWDKAESALARAKPRTQIDWQGPIVPF